MYDSYYNQKILEFLQANWSAVENCLSNLAQISVSAERILGALCFFGMLFVAFKFIRARWSTLC